MPERVKWQTDYACRKTDTLLIVPSVIFNRNYKRRGKYYYARKAQKLYAYKHWKQGKKRIYSHLPADYFRLGKISYNGYYRIQHK